MTETLSPRDEVLTLLTGGRVDRYLCFSGLISVTQPGLESLGLKLADVHHDARKMAAAAAGTHRLFGFDSVAVPLDMCVEAEVLGASIEFEPDDAVLPQVGEPLADTAAGLALSVPNGFSQRGRIPVVCEAIRILKDEFEDGLAIGAWVPGPFTLASMLIEVGGLVMETRTDPESVGSLLDILTEVLDETAAAYHEAGADYLTVHEMGGSPGFIGPAAFEELVLPQLRRLLSKLPEPRVLHVCGHTNFVMEHLATAGADALSVDQLNDLQQSRTVVGDSQVLLGNIDPVAVLADGSPQDVRAAVSEAIESGVNAVWPGCDLMPTVSSDNLRAMVVQTQRSRPERSRYPGE